MTGPVGRALVNSYLAASIKTGMQALSNETRRRVASDVHADFLDSIDLDEATRARHPKDARWDYLLGHDTSSKIVGIETHSASTSQVSRVIDKRARSIEHLRTQLVEGSYVAAWYWIASGRVDFVPHEKTVNRLAQNGIQFVGGRLEPRHLVSLRSPSAQRTRRKRR